MVASQAWLNGQQIPFEQMRLPVWDLAVVAGASISEMARTYAHQPFQLPQHVRRLCDSCDELGFTLPYNSQQLCEAAVGLVHQNTRVIPPGDDLGIVFFVTAGANRTYLGDGPLPGPHVGIHTFRLPFEVWKTAASEGVRLQIPERKQISSHALPVHRKIRNRLHWWLADRDANAIEAGSRALLLNEAGFVTETSAAAFYAVIDGTICSPADDVLDSMSRKLVERAAQALGIGFQLKNLKPTDISQASEAFLSSTPCALLPVKSISGHNMGNDFKVLPRLLHWWEQTTGVHPQRQIRESKAPPT
ncbi:MAG: aminotransferase class IV [Fuerstiella sp.]